MSNVLKAGKQALTTAVVATTVLWSMGLAAIVPAASAATLVAGDLIKASGPAVYYYGSDGKRYVFPNEKTFKTWFANFSSVKTITDSELAAISIGGNVTYRPGTRLIKITTDPKVYAVEPGGKLRFIQSEQIAKDLYGTNWNQWIDDVSDAFFTNYSSGAAVSASMPTVGSLIKTASSSDIYYVDAAGKRKFADFNAFSANNFRSEFILTVADSIANALATGTNVTGMESAIAMFQTTSATPAPGPAPVTGALSVGLAANNPASSTLVAGQATAKLAAFTFSNTTSAERKITSLKLNRIGVSADTTLTAVYLYDGATRLTDSATVSSKVITFNDPSGIFTVAANSTRTVWVLANIAAGSQSQTVGVAINAATDVMTNVSGDTAVGTFPVSGNVHSIAQATLATVDFNATTLPAAANIDPQDEYTMWQNTLSVGTRKVWLKSVRFRMLGSVGPTDLQNFKLLVDGTQRGATVSVLANNYVTFDLSANPVLLDTGSRIVKLLGDVKGGSSRDFKMQVREASDFELSDSDFGANVLPTANSTTFSTRESGTQTINAGSLTVAKRSDSPSSDVVLNGTGTTLAGFDLKAFGEKIKIETLKVQIVTNNSGLTTATQIGNLRNGALYADGVQVGSTADITTAAAGTSFSLGSALVVDPTKTPVKLEVRGDIFDNDGTNNIVTGTTIQVNLIVGTSNGIRQVSGGSLNVPGSATTGNTLTAKQGTLTLSKDQSYGNQTVVLPSQAVKIGQFTLKAGSNDAINLNTIAVDLAITQAGGTMTTASITNLYVKYGTKMTSTKSSVTATTATTSVGNNFSINENLLANASMQMEVYADISTPFTAADFVIPSLTITGTTQSSGTTVNSGTAVAGQTITAQASGNLTVEVSNDTPVAMIAVAGSQPNAGALTIKATSANEDAYIKELTFRINRDADDVSIANVSVYAGANASSMTQVNGTTTFNSDSTNPGYVTIAVSGASRIKVAKDSTMYIMVKPTYVSTGADTSVSAKKPRFFLADLKAEGSAQIAANGTGANLTNASGIIVKSNGTAVYASSTKTLGAAVTSATATTLTSTTAGVFTAGDVIFVDENNDATWDPATEELMTVLADSNPNLTVQRGSFGTTAQAAYTNGRTIYRLDNASTTRGVIGNADTVYGTKPTFTLGSGSPSGATSGGTQKEIFRFNVAADSNTTDASENAVRVDQVDLTVNKSGATISNLVLYPTENDQDATYKTTCGALSATKWRCVLNTTQAKNQIIEGANRTFTVRADVGTTGTNASWDVSIANLGSSNGDGTQTAGDVLWSDLRNGSALTSSIGWAYQSTSAVQGGSQTTGTASGTYDNVAPVLASITVANGGGTLNTVDAGDTLVLVWNEAIDPTSINTGLVPGGSVSGVAAASTGGLTGNNATGVITLTNITTFGAGATLAAAASFTTNLALNAASTQLTITLNTGTARSVGTPAMTTGTTVAGTVKDSNANAQAAVTSPTPTGSF